MENKKIAKAFFLVGPTAVGKSSVAQFIAEEKGYDILSADSMLVYEGMDIGTAKPSKDERGSVPYFGIDLNTPDNSFSVWSYYSHARKVLVKSAAAGRKVIVVGGSGLYIKSLTDGLDETASPENEKRAYWNKVLEDEGVEALQKALIEKNKDFYDSLDDKQNGRRLIRALEKVDLGMTDNPKSWRSDAAPLPGLMMERDVLNGRIEKRVEIMYSQGLLEEVKGLLSKYDDLSETARQAIGYAEVIKLLDGTCTREEAIERTVIRTRQLAKRQRTWFKNQMQVDWVNLKADFNVEDAAGSILEYWDKNGATEVKI